MRLSDNSDRITETCAFLAIQTLRTFNNLRGYFLESSFLRERDTGGGETLSTIITLRLRSARLYDVIVII